MFSSNDLISSSAIDLVLSKSYFTPIDLVSSYSLSLTSNYDNGVEDSEHSISSFSDFEYSNQIENSSESISSSLESTSEFRLNI